MTPSIAPSDAAGLVTAVESFRLTFAVSFRPRNEMCSCTQNYTTVPLRYFLQNLLDFLVAAVENLAVESLAVKCLAVVVAVRHSLCLLLSAS